MRRPDLVLEARAYVQGDLQDVEIGLDLETGTILDVKKTLTGDARLRFPGKWLLPSAVDLHVHFRDPGHPRKEDFRTGTTGAALGGVGTVLDMPNTDPLVDRLSRLEEKQEHVAGKAVVDWGLWATFTPATKNPRELALAAAGVKLYLAPTTGVTDPGGAAELRDRLRFATGAQRLVALHAERPGDREPDSLREHDALRHPEGEVETIRAVAGVAPAEAQVHVAHATTVPAVQAARAAGFSAAATPHHLLLGYDVKGLHARAKVNPPLRAPNVRDALWDAFVAGDVRLVETDHAPHTLEEKARPFREAPAGLPGIQTAYPLLLHQAHRANVPIGRVVDAYAAAPAARLGLRKGLIQKGFDADLVVVDPHSDVPVRGSDLASPCGWTPFEGWRMMAVEKHFLHGDLVVEDSEFIGRVGRGKRIAPQPRLHHRVEP